MKLLVGSTGFVGSNILKEESFDGAYHSTDIEKAYGKNPDLLVYAGLSAAKFIANTNPEADLKQIYQAQNNIEKINPKQLVLISTIDVFKNPYQVDEASHISTDGMAPYGANRYKLECWVREHYPNALIVRLPGLFGINLKKNFIYDLLHPLPVMLSEDKYQEFSKKEAIIGKYYQLQQNGFYRCILLEDDADGRKKLLDAFGRIGFSALNFTDSRSIYQFYPLARLWQDIETALFHNIKLLHMAVEPVSAGELYYLLNGKYFENEIMPQPAIYDYRTRYAELYGGSKGYIMDKEKVVDAIKEFCGRA